jgi:hypothetical protein
MTVQPGEDPVHHQPEVKVWCDQYGWRGRMKHCVSKPKELVRCPECSNPVTKE